MTRIDDPKLGVSQADVYQVMAYSRLYECPHVVLLYPHHGGLPPSPLLLRYSIAMPGARESLFAATIDVTGPRRKHETALRDLIVDCLNGAPSYGRLRGRLVSSDTPRQDLPQPA